MPVEFLSDDQARSYGRYTGEPTPAQLARYFYLDDADRERLADRRGDHNRLGMALQIVTARFLGTFLADPTDVPAAVIASVTAQLGIPSNMDLTSYRDGEARWDHAIDIRKRYEYRDFSEQPEHFTLVRWLYTRAWLSTERPSILFDVATAWLIERKILLPGVSVLARLVARVRDRAAARLWHAVSAIPSEEQRTRLDSLLVVPAGARASALDRLRRAPTRASAPSLVDALKRLKEVRDLGVSHLDLSHIPVGRLTSLARYAATSWAPVIARMPADRRTATLLAFAHVYEASAQDDALDVFDMLIGTLLTRVENEGDKERLRTLRDLDAAALRLRDACRVALDTSFPDNELREAIFAAAGGEDDLEFAITTVGDLTRPPEDHYYEDLLSRYSQIRQFLPTLLRTITFLSTAGGKPVLEALTFLRTLEDQRKPNLGTAPRGVVNRAWRSLVLNADDKIDRHAYTFCALERLQDALRRRDVYVAPSDRWANPRAKLLQGANWEAARPEVCRALGRSADSQLELETLGNQVKAAYQTMASNLPTNTAVRIERTAGRDRLVLTPLDALPLPPSLVALRTQVAQRLPRTDIPDPILEIHARTGFADAFTHISERNARVEDLAISICAVLIAEACNIGLEPLVRPDVPALTRGRLLWV